MASIDCQTDVIACVISYAYMQFTKDHVNPRVQSLHTNIRLIFIVQAILLIIAIRERIIVCLSFLWYSLILICTSGSYVLGNCCW